VTASTSLFFNDFARPTVTAQRWGKVLGPLFHIQIGFIGSYEDEVLLDDFIEAYASSSVK
jgi:hypothetical protein